MQRAEVVTGVCLYLKGNTPPGFTVSDLLDRSYAQMTSQGMDGGEMTYAYQAAMNAPMCAGYGSDIHRWIYGS